MPTQEEEEADEEEGRRADEETGRRILRHEYSRRDLMSSETVGCSSTSTY